MTVLEIPAAVYAAMSALLGAIGKTEDRDGTLRLDGLALRQRPGGTSLMDITVSTLVSQRTQEGRIELAMNGELTQMDLAKAREIVAMLQGAIEAAISDELLYRFLTTKVGLEPEKASAALLDFRELRQGSRERVYPS